MQYKRPESVLIVVYTRSLDCLLLERVRPAGFWQSVTGSLQWGESPAEAAARELIEETGLDPGGLEDAGVERRYPIRPEWRPRYAADVEENLEHWWLLRLPQRVEVRIDPKEHSRCIWLPVAAAAAKVSSSTNREALSVLL